MSNQWAVIWVRVDVLCGLNCGECEALCDRAQAQQYFSPPLPKPYISPALSIQDQQKTIKHNEDMCGPICSARLLASGLLCHPIWDLLWLGPLRINTLLLGKEDRKNCVMYCAIVFTKAGNNFGMLELLYKLVEEVQRQLWHGQLREERRVQTGPSSLYFLHPL